MNRREFVASSTTGVILVGASAVSGRAQAASVPEAATMVEVTTQPPVVPRTGPDYNPVVTLNGWTLPWRVTADGWKEFHLVAEPVEREIAPGMTARLWGYNGQSPGPTIEAVEGDKVRIFVTNKLPEHTTVHWHGLILPSGMDGVGGLTQPTIKPGETFAYEYVLTKSGTFMYHPHADETFQMAMGMMGSFVVHPKDPAFMRVDRDFIFLTAAYDIDPGAYIPKVATMTDFNIWVWNSRAFPGIDPLVVAKGDRVRVRMGNLSMTNHPIHMHGYDFEVTGTDGGWVRESARWPEVSIDLPVGAMRAFEFKADNPGDWAIHCHKSHHTMNAMGHSVRTYIGVDQREIAKRVGQLIPGYMPMGSTGGAAMAEMQMPGPENTLPMMSGVGPFGSVEMGGMFSVVKVREGLARGDFKDPGWYRHPQGTVAYKVQDGAAHAPQTATAAPDANPAQVGAARGGRKPVIELRARQRTLGMQGMATGDPSPAATPTTSSMPGTPMQHDMSTMGRQR